MPRQSLEEWFQQLSGDMVVVGIQRTKKFSRDPRKFWEPKADLAEDATHYIVKVELSGIGPESVQVAYLPDRHSILFSGDRPDEDLPGVRKKAVHQLEIFYGPFQKEVALPDQPIEADGLRAHYRSGFLYVLVPKAKVTVRHTRVTIYRA